MPDESHVLQYDSVEHDDHLTFIKEPIMILARDVRQLYSRELPWLRTTRSVILLRRIPGRPSETCGSSNSTYLSPQVCLYFYFLG